MQEYIQFAYYVYITTNKEKQILETGTTGDLMERLHQLENGLYYLTKTAARKDCYHLVYWESYMDATDAVAREKEIKKLPIKKKKELIETLNPHWQPLNDEIRVNNLKTTNRLL